MAHSIVKTIMKRPHSWIPVRSMAFYIDIGALICWQDNHSGLLQTPYLFLPYQGLPFCRRFSGLWKTVAFFIQWNRTPDRYNNLEVCCYSKICLWIGAVCKKKWQHYYLFCILKTYVLIIRIDNRCFLGFVIVCFRKTGFKFTD